MKNSSLKLCEINEFSASHDNVQFKLLVNSITKRTEGLIYNNTRYFLKRRKYGSYGRIYVMRNSENNESIVLKRFESNEDYLKEKIVSIIVSNIQKDCNCSLNIVPSYWHEMDYNFIVMHYRDFTVHDLIFNNRLNYNPFEIFLQVVESVYDLYKYGIYYCDLKVANILIKTIGSKMKVSLGDLGGIVFSNSNILHNLFYSKDIENTKFIIEYPDYQIKIWLGKKYYKIGNTNVYNESLVGKDIIGKDIIVKQIKEKSAILDLEGTVKTLDSLYIDFDECIFTFPHLKNPTGIIKFSKNDSKDFRRNIIMNNIFQSLGIIFVQLLFKSFFNMNNDFIDKYYEKSVNEIITLIDKSNFEFLERLLINEIIFGTSTFDGLISENYSDYRSDILVRSKFDFLLKKIKILMS